VKNRVSLANKKQGNFSKRNMLGSNHLLQQTKLNAVTQHTTACYSTQVVDITLMKLHFTNITSLRVVQ
jgi:hypothetical protein